MCAKAGDYQQAVELLGRALRLNPKMALSHSSLGNIYRMMGRYEEALESCRRAILLKPDLAEAHQCLGMTLADSGKHKIAVDSLKRAISLQPELGEAHYTLGIVYLMLKDRNAAIAQYRLLKGIDKGLARQFSESLYGGVVINVKPK